MPDDAVDGIDELCFGIDDLIRDRTERRREIHARFAAEWEDLERDHAWSDLVDVLARPLTPASGDRT